MQNECVTAAILAGGRASRMGGSDKGLLLLEGVSLAGRVVKRIAPCVDEILITANRNLEFYSGFGLPVFSDEGCGPLSGLRQAMRFASCPLILTLPCDTPFFPENLVENLRAGLLRAGAQIAIPESAGKTHHAIMLCRNELFSDLDEFLEKGGRKVRDWQERYRHVMVPFPEPNAFFNINTQEDLKRAKSIFSA
ncbi:MAG: molybdenum cofactor guanylyltransferase [Burkholderiales bacterium]|nr:molybdenum cofactor guanylyltransferase [Burkholderiales bacterium]